MEIYDIKYIWLVVDFQPLWKIWVRQFWDEHYIPNMWKNKNMFQTTNQLWFYMVLLGLSWFDCFDGLRTCMQVQREHTSEPRVRLSSDPAKLFPRLWIPCITGWLWTLWFPAIHGQSQTPADHYSFRQPTMAQVPSTIVSKRLLHGTQAFALLLKIDETRLT